MDSSLLISRLSLFPWAIVTFLPLLWIFLFPSGKFFSFLKISSAFETWAYSQAFFWALVYPALNHEGKNFRNLLEEVGILFLLAFPLFLLTTPFSTHPLNSSILMILYLTLFAIAFAQATALGLFSSLHRPLWLALLFFFQVGLPYLFFLLWLLLGHKIPWLFTFSTPGALSALLSRSTPLYVYFIFWCGMSLAMMLWGKYRNRKGVSLEEIAEEAGEGASFQREES